MSASASEIAALVAFYEATNGAGWTTNKKLGWCVDPAVCVPDPVGPPAWGGVALHPGGGVRDLSMDSASLQGTLPTQLALLTALQKLFVHSNKNTPGGGLSGTLPSQLGLITSLQELKVQSNGPSNSIGLSGTLPSQLGLIASLQELRANDNHHISGTLPTSLPGTKFVLRLPPTFAADQAPI